MTKKQKQEPGPKRQASVWPLTESRPNLIMGLGNPGKKYENTYHNVGRIFLDFLKEKIGKNWEPAPGKKFEYVKTGTVFLVITSSFMNESGESISSALNFFSLQPKDLLIAHDDSDLIIGHYKLSKDKNSAGHKGVQSIIDTLKTSAKGACLSGRQGSASGGKNFWRLRIGIRPEKEKIRSKTGLPDIARRAKAGEFVLKKIKDEDLEKLYSVFNEVIEKLIVKVVP